MYSQVKERKGSVVLNDYPDGALTGQYEFLDHDILMIKGIVPFAKDLIAASEKLNIWGESPLIRGTSNQYYDEGMRNNKKCDVRGSLHPDFGPFENKLIHVTHAAVKLYMMDNTFISLTKDEGYQILRYTKDQHFRPHIDSIMGRPNEGSRAVSAVVFLNDDYEGGELNFPRQGVTVRPQAESVVLFPSYFTHIHESCDIKSGIKYSVVTWFS